MTKVVVTEKALREMVHEAMWNKEFSGWSANHDEPINVNSDVDPSIMITDPVNPNFTPQNKTEFSIAVNQLVKNLPDSEMSGLYDTVKTAIDNNEKEKNEDKMTKKAADGGTAQIETVIRQHIRKILSEMNVRLGSLSEAKPFDWKNAPPPTGPLPPVKKIPPGVHGGEAQRRIDKNTADLRKGLGKAVDTYEAPPTDADHGIEEPANPNDPNVGDGIPDEPESGEQVTAEPASSGDESKRKAYKSTALGGMSDVGGASFEQIAKELGFSIAGAKQAVDKALEKARFLLNDMDDEDREILTLTAMNDYIKYLTKSGELTPADIQLMKDHPDIVRELDGFREFLHNHIRRARKADQKVYDPLEDDTTAGGEPVLDDDSAEASAPETPSPAAAPRMGGKTSYKIYKGGARYGNKPVVTRYKGKVYGPSGESQFNPNDTGIVSPGEDGKLNVKKPDSDHTQSWEPVGEGKRPVLLLKRK